MQDTVLQAQHLALEAQAREMTLNEQLAQLKQDLQRENDTKQLQARYILTQMHPEGDVVYALRSEHVADEPLHTICPACFDVRNRKVVLLRGPRGSLKCPRCEVVFVIDPTIYDSIRSQNFSH